MKCKSITRLFVFLPLLFVVSTSGYALGQTAREPDPKYLELLESAVSSMKAGDKDQALAVLDKAIAFDQKVVLAYIVKAKILLLTKDYKSALAALDAGISNCPDDAELYSMRAEAYIADNQTDRAIADLRKTKEICQSKNDKGGEVVADVQLERLTSTPSADAKITWRKDVMELVSGKESVDKPLLVDVYTDWCGWCKVMDEKTYAGPFVAKYLSDNFICVKLNADDKAEGSSFATSMGVDGYPCTCIIDVKKKARTSISGFAEPDDFLAKVKLALLSFEAK